LLLGLLACNFPARIQTPPQIESTTKIETPMQVEMPAQVEMPPPTATFIPTETPPPTATFVSGYPLITVPIQAVRVMDDDGGRITKINSEQIAAWVSRTNEIYAWSGIRFTFDKQDFSLLQSTLLNNIAGVEDKNWFEEIAYANQVTARYPDKLVVIFRWGPGDQPTGGAFSWVDYDFVAMPGFEDTGVCGYQNIGILAHEIGHYLGLVHTFPGVYKNVAEAEAVLKNNGNKPFTFDADGLSDTLPDPFIATDEYQCQPTAGVTLNGIFFPIPRENIMSYYEVRTGLSEMQIERARWVLATRMTHGMSLPKNSTAPHPLEVQNLSLSQSGCSTIHQDMSPWGKQQWNEGDQLFVTSSRSCALIFGLPVEQAGMYRLELYLTSAPDFGRIQVYLDGKPVGEPIDLYTPMVMPTGAISVGTFDLSAQTHQLTFMVVGTNEKSKNYSFGLDCFSLIPQP
jgi:hypothetical protein